MSAPYYEDEWVTLHAGDCLDVLRELPDASVDSVVTDPPYGLGFMGKEWDSGKSFVERKAAKVNTYVTATRSNVGECLALGCGCRGFVGAESAQDPHFVRDSGASTWDNVASPQGALTPAGSDHRSILETNGG